MAMYRVRWEIDVEAETPYEAAVAARKAQVRPGTIATVFEVSEHVGPGEPRWRHCGMFDLGKGD